MLLFILILSFFFFPVPVLAARSMNIRIDKSILTNDEDLTITASISGFASESFYVKGVFFRKGSKNYFGLTKKEAAWIKNSAKTIEQRQVTLPAWDNTVTIRSDYTDSGFSGNGEYLVKLGYYVIAADGDSSTVHWSDNAVAVELFRSPLPTPTQKPSSTPVPSKTPVPTSTMIPSPTVQIEHTQAVKVEVLPSRTPLISTISSSPVSRTVPTLTAIATVSGISVTRGTIHPLFFLFLGVGIGSSVASLFALGRTLQMKNVRRV